MLSGAVAARCAARRATRAKLRPGVCALQGAAASQRGRGCFLALTLVGARDCIAMATRHHRCHLNSSTDMSDIGRGNATHTPPPTAAHCPSPTTTARDAADERYRRHMVATARAPRHYSRVPTHSVLPNLGWPAPQQTRWQAPLRACSARNTAEPQSSRVRGPRASITRLHCRLPCAAPPVLQVVSMGMKS